MEVGLDQWVLSDGYEYRGIRTHGTLMVHRSSIEWVLIERYFGVNLGHRESIEVEGVRSGGQIHL
jgi:hypothetical protein